MRSSIKRVARLTRIFSGFDVADVDDIEKSVVDLRVGRDFHSAAEKSGVADAEIYRVERFFFSFINFDVDGFEIQV